MSLFNQIHKKLPYFVQTFKKQLRQLVPNRKTSIGVFEVTPKQMQINNLMIDAQMNMKKIDGV